MTVAAIYRMDKIVCGSDFTVQIAENLVVAPGIQTLVERAAGERAPNWVGTDKTTAMANFTTQQLATVLGAVGVGGLAITGNTDVYQKLATSTANTARATTSHHRIRAASVLAYWTRITLPNQGRATMDVTLCPVYDGSNEPYVYAGGVALSGSIAASALAFFQCGPLYLNGSSMGAIQEIIIESGAREVPYSSDGEHHQTFRCIETIEPTVTFKTINGTSFNSPGPAGLALNGSTGCVAYARKIAQNGARVANATEEHISFTSLYGRALLIDSRATGTKEFEETIKVEITVPDDTTSIMAIDVTAAIP